MGLTHATARGSRTEQQDRYVLARIPRSGTSPGIAGQFLAVMDGHGGSTAADRISAAAVGAFENALQRSKGSIERGLADFVAELANLTKELVSGSTLSVVFIPDDQKTAHIAILGDSPVTVIGANHSLGFSPLHNVRTNSADRAEALKKGGRFINGYLEDPHSPGDGIQLTRALGDRALAKLLNQSPEVYSVPLDQDSRIVLATDGIFDSMETAAEIELRRIIDLVTTGYDAQDLVDDALKRRTGDNVTVILWKP